MIFFNRISYVDKLLFTKHLSIMLKSGIPVAESLSILSSQNLNHEFGKIQKKIYESVSNGQSFYKTLSAYPNVFDKLYLSFVDVGEQSGNLETNLEYLALQMQKEYEFKKKVTGAFIYPVFIIIVAVILGGGISFFVLPQLANLFSSLGLDLPLPTRILLWFANLMRFSGPLIFAVLFGITFLFSMLINNRFVKPFWQSFLLRLPIFGLFIQNAQIATFCRNLGLMLKSGLPINEALNVSVESTDNLVFKRSIKLIASAVEKGKSIESEMDNRKFWFFPVIVSRMIGVGERTGKLDETLLYLGDFFEQEVDGMAKNLPTILEPILLTMIAAVVAFVAFAIISPIYQFTSGVKR